MPRSYAAQVARPVALAACADGARSVAIIDSEIQGPAYDEPLIKSGATRIVSSLQHEASFRLGLPYDRLSSTEAIQTAKLNVASFPVPGTHGFFLLDEEGIEVSPRDPAQLAKAHCRYRDRRGRRTDP
jgi:hypothetical protein